MGNKVPSKPNHIRGDNRRTNGMHCCIDDENFEILQPISRINLARGKSVISVEDFYPEDSGYSEAAFMEKLDKMVWQNPSNPQTKEIESLTKNYINSILDEMKSVDAKWDFNVIDCGSYYEGLRVSMPIEFDYMLQVKSDSLQGHIILKPESPLDNSTFSVSTLFKQEMISIFRETVRRINRFEGLRLLEVQDTYNSPNFQLLLKYKDQGIMVDLVPCIKFPPEKKSLLPRYNEQTLQFMSKLFDLKRDKIIDFIEDNLYLVGTPIQYQWRLSSSVIEMDIMKSLPDGLKRELRVLKYLCNTHLIHRETYGVKHLDENRLHLFGYKPFIPSYLIKVSFLDILCKMLVQDSQDNDGQTLSSYTFHDKTVSQEVLSRLKEFCRLVPSRVLELNSILFGPAITHKFYLLQDLSGQNLPLYEKMVLTVEAIINETGRENNFMSELKNRKVINYPCLNDVRCLEQYLDSWIQD